MRRSEIANLTWENVDFKGKTAYLSETKNMSERTVPLSPAAIRILKSIPRRISGSVFGMSENAITIAMRRARKNAEIKDLTFHDLHEGSFYKVHPINGKTDEIAKSVAPDARKHLCLEQMAYAAASSYAGRTEAGIQADVLATLF